jgi:hypothetical protein
LLVVVAAAYNRQVQTRVTKEVALLMERKFGAQISFHQARYNFFNKISLDNILIRDLNKDTLVYADLLEVKTPNILRKITVEKDIPFRLNEINMEGGYINFFIDENKDINFKFFIDSLKSRKDTTKEKKPFEIRKIMLQDCRYSMVNADTSGSNSRINFQNFHLTGLNIDIDDFKTFGDTVSMDINAMNFTEKSGFRVRRLSSKFELCNNFMKFQDVRVITNKSDLNSKKIFFKFKQFKDFGGGSFFSKVWLDYNIIRSNVWLDDVGYFTRAFENTHQKIEFMGKLKGTVSNLKGDDISFKFGRNSSFRGNFEIVGLPDVKEALLLFDLNQLSTTPSDLLSVSLPGNASINFPAYISNIKRINYSGNFTGYINDFVAYGTLRTDLGTVTTDLLLKPDSVGNLTFNGKIKTREFDIGKLLDKEPLLSKTTFNGLVDGSSYGKGKVKADFSGHVNRFFLNGYDYSNIDVTGHISNNTFDGHINIDDPNVQCEFDGIVDYSGEMPRYDFTANISSANLYALNINKKDPNYTVSMLVKANASGNSLDNINGEIKLLNSLFINSRSQIQLYDLSIFANNTKETNELLVRSDFMDATLTGSYKFDDLKPTLVHFIGKYVPGLVQDMDTTIIEKDHQFTFKLNLKNTEPIFRFFLPNYYVAPGSKLTGEYISQDDGIISFHLESPEIRMKNNIIKGINISMQSNDSSLTLTSGSQQLLLANRIELDNFTVYSYAAGNEINTLTRWINWDSALYRGALETNISFENIEKNKITHVSFEPTSVTIHDTVWNIGKCALDIDSSGIKFKHVEISNNDALIAVNGKKSTAKEDTLDIEFKNFNLANINYFLQNELLNFQGIINGTAYVTGEAGKPEFISDLEISNMYMNGELLGDCTIKSKWNSLKNSIGLSAVAKRGTLNTVDINGEYFPFDKGRLNFEIILDKLYLDIANPFLAGIFSDIRGLGTGSLDLTGYLSAPILNGRLNLQKTAATIDYLKTRYNFTNYIDIVNNTILFDNVVLYDEKGNTAQVEGVIKSKYLKDYEFNLLLKPKNFMCLNTTSKDNDLYWGKAFATGSARIKGTPNNISLVVDASSDKGTTFYLSLTENGEIDEYSYIRFENQDTVKNKEQPEKINRDEQQEVGMDIEFNMDITPDAEVQIILESQFGDVIKGRGKGEMKLNYNSSGTISLVGEYVIHKGNYEIFGKPFEVEDGGIITWSGDPVDATLNIKAIYTTTASLKDILGEDIDNAKTRTKVDCIIDISGSLLTPNIRYEIYLPNADDELRAKVNSRITSEEELSKQFLSLLILNRFYYSGQLANLNDNSSNTASADFVGVSASELLFSQLNNWLSQISNDVNVGVNYRPGIESNNSEVEVMIETQMLNDKLTIQGNLDVAANNAATQSSSNIVGDVDIDYKITQNGKLRARAFNHSNDYTTAELSPYTQGLGFTYQEDFNTFGELIHKYWNSITGKNRKNKEEKAEKEKNVTTPKKKEAVIQDDKMSD